MKMKKKKIMLKPACDLLGGEWITKHRGVWLSGAILKQMTIH